MGLGEVGVREEAEVGLAAAALPRVLQLGPSNASKRSLCQALLQGASPQARCLAVNLEVDREVDLEVDREVDPSPHQEGAL